MLKQNDITMIEMERSAVQRDAESQGLSAEKYATVVSHQFPRSNSYNTRKRAYTGARDSLTITIRGPLKCED